MAFKISVKSEAFHRLAYISGQQIWSPASHCFRKRGFLDAGFNDGTRHLAAFSTLGGNPELAADISKRGRSTCDGFPDLTVGNSFTEAYVHRACAAWKWLMGEI